MAMDRRIFLKSIGLGTAAVAAHSLFPACSIKPSTTCSITPPKPNILFIMSDDHARQAISCYSDKLMQTPGIDRIAKKGIRFKNSFVTNSICAPSRATLLTGKFGHKNGLRDNRDKFDNTQQTFVKLLQQSGYETSIIGKWHLKCDPTGFDHWNILIGQGEYYNPRLQDKDGIKNIEGYTTDILTDLAIETLENRDQDKPFCMLLHHKAPHRNWLPNLKHLGAFDDTEFPMPDNLFDDYKNRKAAAQADMHIDDMFMSFDFKLRPGDYEKQTGSGGLGHVTPEPRLGYRDDLNEEQLKVWDKYYNPICDDFKKKQPKGNELTKWKYQRYMHDYLSCILSVDENVARVLDYLEQKELLKNTLVVYTSDQGFYLGEHGWYDKRFMYEESFSMPLVMSYPKNIPSAQVNEDLVMNLDFAPTFLDYAGVEIPVDMQGKSMRPILEGKTPEDWRKAVYYHFYSYPHGWHKVKRHYGIRTRRYKLIHFYHDIDTWELYDLEEDPSEMNNLYGNPEYTEITQKLHTQLKALIKKYEDQSMETI